MAATGGAADANAERRKPRHFAVAGRDTFTKRSREDHQFALSAPPGGELVPDLRACAGTGSGRGRMIAAPGSIRSRSIFDTPPTRRGRVPLACGSGVLVGTSPQHGASGPGPIGESPVSNAGDQRGRHAARRARSGPGPPWDELLADGVPSAICCAPTQQ
jgi:hypothetical protein